MKHTSHFNSTEDINTDVLEKIMAIFIGRPIVITVEEMDETTFLLSNPDNKDMFSLSIAQDENGESISVNIEQ